MDSRFHIPDLVSLLNTEHGELAPILASLLDLYNDLPPQVHRMDMNFLENYPPGHYYSPLPSMDEVVRVSSRVWGRTPETLPSIDLCEREQLRLFARFTKHYKDIPFKPRQHEGLRYYFENNIFGYADAIALHCMMREFKPKRIIEVGSGFSSCVMLDTDEYFLDKSTEFTFIEPYPERLLANIKPEDKKRINLIIDIIQNVDLSVFNTLQKNDILFIDCSHVGKIGSDVLHILFEILPRINHGVIIHIHDIFFPFEYPKKWVTQDKRAWNESYFLRSFLQYNEVFKIIYFNSYLGTVHRQVIQRHMPLCLKNTGSSIWLRKTT